MIAFIFKLKMIESPYYAYLSGNIYFYIDCIKKIALKNNTINSK